MFVHLTSTIQHAVSSYAEGLAVSYSCPLLAHTRPSGFSLDGRRVPSC